MFQTTASIPIGLLTYVNSGVIDTGGGENGIRLEVVQLG